MEKATSELIKKLYRPDKNSHKGQNGKLTIIGGSKLFHGASLWALKTASRIVDMVFYSTVGENQELSRNLKSDLYDFIFIPRSKIDDYIPQSDAVLIGPGMVRGDKSFTGTGESGEETKRITKDLLTKFPDKKWVIDAGALQTMDPELLKNLRQAIITPHKQEFLKLFNISDQSTINNQQLTIQKSKEYGCTIVLKGPTDVICSPKNCILNETGNEGMTKGGTGDVLAGLIAALACKNDLFLAAAAGAYINGLAGDELYKKVGPYFNASDLCDQIPYTMKKLITI